MRHRVQDATSDCQLQLMAVLVPGAVHRQSSEMDIFAMICHDRRPRLTASIDPLLLWPAAVSRAESSRRARP